MCAQINKDTAIYSAKHVSIKVDEENMKAEART